MSSAVVEIPNTDIGALLAGAIIASVAYGFTTSEAFVYFMRGRKVKESSHVRYLVMALWTVGTAQLAFICHAQYYYFVTNYANPEVFSVPIWSMTCVVLLTALVGSMTRLVFITNIWKKSFGNVAVGAALGILAAFNLVMGVIFTVKSTTAGHNFSSIKLWTILFLCSAILADASITATTIIYLNKETGTATTPENVLDRFIDQAKGYVVGTGVVSLAFAILILILYVTMPGKFIFFAPFMIWSSLYISSVFVAFNASRRKLGLDSLSLSLSSNQRYATQSASSPRHHVPPQVSIIQETIIERDDIKAGPYGLGDRESRHPYSKAI